MKSSKKITSLLLTLIVLVLSLTALFACKDDGFTVNFESNGGTSVNDITVATGEKLAAPAVPKKDGYVFAGWTTPDGQLWDFETVITEDITLIASWVKSSDANIVTLTFDSKGGSTVEKVQINKGTPLSAPVAPTKTGYDFAGWYYLGEAYTFGTSVASSDMTFIAKWTPVTYTVAYELAGGKNAEGNPTEYTFESENLSISAPSREGYYFLGWTTEGQPTPDKAPVITRGSVGNKTYTAVWELAVYSVNYDFAGGNANASQVYSYTYGTGDVTIPMPTKENYTFAGWTVEGIDAPVMNYVITNGTSGDVTLVANWELAKYKMNYKLEDGINNASNPEFITTETETFRLQPPTRIGYKFTGWTFEGQATPVMEVEIAKGSALAASSLTFTANWELYTYTITYNTANGSTVSGEKLLESFGVGQLPYTLPDMYLNNKCFVSWYTDAGFENEIKTVTEYKDITLYAKFVDPSENLEFTLIDSSYYMVSGYTGNDSVVYVPEYYKGYPVLFVGEKAFLNNDSITKIYLPVSTMAVLDQAFFGCNNLSEIVISDRNELLYIASYAFAETALTEINLPKSLQIIGDNAFLANIKLEAVNFAENSELVIISSHAFAGCNALKGIEIPKSVGIIGDNAFYANASLATVKFAEDSELIMIGASSFAGCTSITEIKIPKSVGFIGEYAFDRASLVAKIEFEENSNLVSIEKGTFSNCDSLVEITIPEGVVIINERAFDSANNLTAVKFEGESQLVVIGAYAFSGCAKLEGFALPEGVMQISQNAFANCKSLSVFKFNENLATIGKSAFSGCSALTELLLPKSVLEIGDGAFSGCSSVTALALPFADKATNMFGGALPKTLTSAVIYGGKEVEKAAFEGCTLLESLEIPTVNIFAELFGKEKNPTVPTSLKTVKVTGGTKLVSKAFENCSGITTLVLPDSITEIGEKAFSGCDSLTSLTLTLSVAKGASSEKATFAYIFGETIPASLKTVTVLPASDSASALPEGAFVGSYVETVVLEDGFTAISKDAFKNVVTLKSVTLPETLNEIGESAFEGASKLSSIAVPDAVTAIESRAFALSGVANVSFGEESKLTALGTGAFEGAANLSAFVIPAGVTAIPENAFKACTSLEAIELHENIASVGDGAFLEATALSAVTVKEGSVLSAIGKYAFSKTAITSFTVPAGVSKISESAFEGSAIASVLFLVDEENVKALTIDKNAFASTSVKAIELPARLVVVGEGAFSGCTALEAVSFAPNASLNTLETRAFEDCTALKAISIPDNVSVLSEAVFKGCSALEAVSFGEKSNLKSIEAYAFMGCSALKSFALPKEVAVIGEYAFSNCQSLASFSIKTRESFYIDGAVFTKEACLKEIREAAFENCDALTSITLPASLDYVGKSAFYSCNALETVTFEENSIIKTIEDYAFRGCEKLALLVLPESLEEIKAFAFYDCKALASVVIPENSKLSVIGDSAFSYCEKLTSFSAPASLETIGAAAFKGAALETAKLSSKLVFVSSYAFQDNEKLVITVVCENENSKDECLNRWSKEWNTDSYTVIWSVPEAEA